jgi:hypothetical protein
LARKIVNDAPGRFAGLNVVKAADYRLAVYDFGG